MVQHQEQVPIELTEHETAVLRAMYASEYYSGGDEAWVWTFSVKPDGVSRSQISGVISSLVKKGVVEVGGSGTKDDMYSVCTTSLGIDLAKNLGIL